MDSELQRHYGLLLGVRSPWRVKDVELRLEDKEVEIELEWEWGKHAECPVCGRGCSIYDSGSERTWRHLDTMQLRTLIRARTPRANCAEHGVKTVRVPWAEPGGVTNLFERFAIDVLLASGSVSQACGLLGISWDAAQRIIDRAVARAWAIKETFARFREYESKGWARKFFREWFGWARRSWLKPMVEVAQMLKRHLDNLLTYLKHHITNAVTEGLNSKIQSLKSAARGFRSFANHRNRILFFCGKLDLYPQ
ncbi:MAG: transposase [Verrucomicrobiia bacterium]